MGVLKTKGVFRKEAIKGLVKSLVSEKLLRTEVGLGLCKTCLGLITGTRQKKIGKLSSYFPTETGRLG